MTNNNDQVALASLAPNHRANAERLISCLPLLVLPAAAILARAHLAPWAFMWVLALAIFLACKWLTWFPHRRDAARAPARSALYLLAWPGMDAVAFLGRRVPPRLDLRQWLATVAKMLLGAVLLFILPRRLYPQHPILAAFSAMPGLVLLIHFGGLHLIALAFQSRGINAQPLMLSPARAQSLADFWGRRWNTGFVTLSRDFVFRPLVPIIGGAGATAITFLASGIVHDLVISLPARGGYGLPTLYFLIQFFGLLVQRSHPARRLGLARGIRGRAFTAAFILLPLPLLLHGAFIRNVILPFLHALGVLGSSAHFSHRKELIMPALSTLLLIGGVLHLGITSAGIVMTLVLDWRKNLAPLAALTRHIIWTHAAFVLLTIIGFASVSLLAAPSLASGSPLARAVCGFIALFWAIRLIIQFFLFDPRPFLTRRILAIGYHGLTVVFTYFVAVYGLAALSPIR